MHGGRAWRAGRKGAAPVQSVYVLDENGKPKRVTVTTGVSDGSLTEITSGGLQPGERVVVAAFGKNQERPAGGFGSQGGSGRRGPGF